MISFTLGCDKGHEFDGWFKSSDAFNEQVKRKIVTCPHCGSAKIQKTLMAPNIGAKSNKKVLAAAGSPKVPEVMETLRQMRQYVEQSADYVGDKFAEEARRIHYEEVEVRGIYGEASTEDVRELNEEGIEVHPLPALPEDKN